MVISLRIAVTTTSGSTFIAANSPHAAPTAITPASTIQPVIHFMLCPFAAVKRGNVSLFPTQTPAPP